MLFVLGKRIASPWIEGGKCTKIHACANAFLCCRVMSYYVSLFFKQVHISKSASVADHCTSYALSDPNESVYQSPCDHQHKEVCDRCEMLKLVLQEIDVALTAQGAREELTFKVKQVKNAIFARKSHLLHSVNQDAARLDVLDLLGESSVLLVQDWAIKCLPRKYRESQKDWFGKRGLPWHVTSLPGILNMRRSFLFISFDLAARVVPL